MLKKILVGTALLLGSPCLMAQTVLGLGPANTLVRFSATSPAAVASSVTISGINAGDTLIGLDVRPANGFVYAVASSGRIYQLDPTNGAAFAGAQISETLSGTVFGVDFNPAADRLRVVSNTGQNLRINVTDGATIVDGPINPGTPMITEVAYTNSNVNPTPPAGTALYDIDVVSSTLFQQNPANSGTLAAIGPLGVTIDAGSSVGFDIRTVGATNTAFAALTVGGTTSLYNVSLTTGAATLIGAVGGNPMLRGISIVDSPLLPALPPSATALGLRTDNSIIRFPAASPSGPVSVAAVTGLVAGDTLIGIDYRPANGLLYAASAQGRLYTIDPVSGAATLGAMISVQPVGNFFAFDFNPAADRLRLVSDTGQNLRINVDTGATIVDGSINGVPGAVITAVGYTNSFAGTTSTALFDIDATSGNLYVQNSANSGTLQLVGPLGVVPGGDSGLDIYSFNGNNAANATLQVGGVTGFYQIDLTSGAASLVGNIAGNPTLRGLAITPFAIGVPAVNVPVPVDSRLALLLLALGTVLLGAFGLRRARS